MNKVLWPLSMRIPVGRTGPFGLFVLENVDGINEITLQDVFVPKVVSEVCYINFC